MVVDHGKSDNSTRYLYNKLIKKDNFDWMKLKDSYEVLELEEMIF
jgi:hypothetical protein